MRKAASMVLMMLAVLLAFASVFGAYVDRLATTPGPLRSIAGPLATDEDVRAALPPELSAAIRERVSQQIQVPAALGPLLDRATTSVVDAVLDDPGFGQAWLESIDTSREGYVDQLRMVHAGTSTTAEPTLELGPVAALGQARLQKMAAQWGFQDLMAPLPKEPDLSIPLDIEATQGGGAAAMAQGLAAAVQWRWAAGAAAVLALAGFLLGGRGTRWTLLAAAGAVAALAGGAVMVVAAAMSDGGAAGAGGGELAAAVRDRLLDGLSGQVGELGGTVAWWGVGVLVVAGVIRVLVGRRINR